MNLTNFAKTPIYRVQEMVRRGTKKIKEEFWVYPYRTNAVDITLDW